MGLTVAGFRWTFKSVGVAKNIPIPGVGHFLQNRLCGRSLRKHTIPKTGHRDPLW